MSMKPETDVKTPSARTLRGLDWLIFFLSDVQTGVGPFLAILAIGIVGRQLFDRRQGCNQTFNSAGNIVAAISMGLLGYHISNSSIFLFVLGCTLPTLLGRGFKK
jgi:hypothetical protein